MERDILVSGPWQPILECKLTTQSFIREVQIGPVEKFIYHEGGQRLKQAS